ncbi:hypothetical protein OSB04_021643, partial [Centaurea solstitialis]
MLKAEQARRTSEQLRSTESEHGDWQKVERRRRSRRSSSNFFFTGFPDSWDVVALGKLFMRYGRVTSLYLAKKRTSKGTKFGFVRFTHEDDEKSLEKHLQGIYIGSKRLVINLEKFDRTKGRIERKRDYPEKPNSKHNVPASNKPPPYGKFLSSGTEEGRSFKQVVLGERGSSFADKKEIEATVNVDYLGRLNNCWMGEVKNIDLLRNITYILKEDGMGSCKIHYLGGLSILCEWNSFELAKKSIKANKEMLNHWFSVVQLWKEASFSPKRLTWIDIQGLPPESWCVKTIQSIAESFGKVLELDEPSFDGNMVNSFGALIVTKSMADINTVVKVKVGRKWCLVKVLEEHNRLILSPSAKDIRSEPVSDQEDDDLSCDGVSDTFSTDGRSPENSGGRNSLSNDQIPGTSPKVFPPSPGKAATDFLEEQMLKVSRLGGQPAGIASSVGAHAGHGPSNLGGPRNPFVISQEDVSFKAHDDISPIRKKRGWRPKGLVFLRILGILFVSMKVLSINCCGLKAKGKTEAIRDLMQKEKCMVLGLQETKSESFSDCWVSSLWGQRNIDYIFSSASGLAGGILLSWDSDLFVDPALLRPDEMIMILNLYLVNRFQDQDQETNESVLQSTDPVTYLGPTLFTKDLELIGPNYCGVIGDWKNIDTKVGLINVYGPQSVSLKSSLWDDLQSIILSSLDVIWVIMGDFNAVRFQEERKGSLFDYKEAADFNHFISVAGLQDIQFCGRRFTRFSKDGKKMSKLDRFLVTANFFSFWKDPFVQVLHRTISDHCPIVLNVDEVNFGPKPFRVFDSWLIQEDFQQVVSSSWAFSSFQGTADYVLKEKFKALKKDLKGWSKLESERKLKRKVEIEKALLEWDLKAELGTISEAECRKREEWIFESLQLSHRDKMDLKQKSRVKWAVEGDENSKYFHAIVNQRRRRNNVKGLILEGSWSSDPIVIKDAIFSHFAGRFKDPSLIRPLFFSSLFRRLSPEDANWLERPFSLEEVKNAVWACNGTKSPGPDGLNFNFIKKFWQVIGNSIFAAVHHFEVTGLIGRGCNASFLSLIPKKVDPLEISDYRPINLLGCFYKIVAKLLAGRMVDMEKAFDTVNWNFLFHSMEQMGFGKKWINWIRGCLNSASISILINGSPTKEFQMERGLRQGDPLSPFLFLIAGEVLQLMILEACNKGLFKGIQMATSNRNLSLLQFADDALVFGEWSKKNLFMLSKLLNCFFDVSGLRINLSKCSLFGIGVSDSEVSDMAGMLKCKASSFPFKYLGLPVGGIANKKSFWSDVVEKVTNKLSAWKSSCLSIGGRFTLLKSVLSAIPLYYFSLFKAPVGILKALESIRRRFFWGHRAEDRKMKWIAWNQITKSQAAGGLGVVSLNLKNKALLGIWRFLVEKDAVWKDVISEIYGSDGGFFSTTSRVGKGTWGDIVSCSKEIVVSDHNLISSFKKTIAKDSNSLFWKDDAIEGGSKLQVLFPRLYALDKDKNSRFKDRWSFINGSWCGLWDWRTQVRGRSVADLQNMVLLLCNQKFNTSGSDLWSWTWNKKGSFSVNHLSHLLQRSMEGGVNRDCRWIWNPLIPIKVNIFTWRLLKEAVPTRFNLSRRGIAIQSLACVLCGEGTETLDHCFFSCPLASGLWKKIWAWWDLKSTGLSSFAGFKKLVQQMGIHRKWGNIFLAVCAVAIWQLWKRRNGVLFADEASLEKKRHEDPFPVVQNLTKLWFGNRNHSFFIDYRKIVGYQ